MNLNLNLGCGQHTMHGWHNIDLVDYPMIIKHDLSQGLPNNYQEYSVDFIYTEHFIEHITRDQAILLLKDCYRVLRVGGAIRISTPNLGSLIEDYRNNFIKRFEGAWEPKTRCAMINEGMRLWGHQYLYDYEEILILLTECGFKDIRKKEYHVSDFSALRKLEVRPYRNDLILEAIK